MSLLSVVGAGLRIVAAALVVLGISVLAMAVAVAPSPGEAPRWVHALSALPFFCAAAISFRVGSFLRRDRPL
jgi:ABC-type multidrug transport system permease subunit